MQGCTYVFDNKVRENPFVHITYTTITFINTTVLCTVHFIINFESLGIAYNHTISSMLSSNSNSNSNTEYSLRVCVAQILYT